MKRVLFICGLLCCLVTYPLLAVAADRTITDAEGKSVVLRESRQPGFFHYIDGCFPFAVDVPALFTKAVELPDNCEDGTVAGGSGSSIILSDAENEAEFRSSGGRLAGQLTIREFFASERKDLGVKPAYEKLGKDFFVLSWIKDGKIHYRKLNLNVDTWFDMEMSYPDKRKKEFDPLVMHSAKSLKYFTK